jgi:hypothetical protein
VDQHVYRAAGSTAGGNPLPGILADSNMAELAPVTGRRRALELIAHHQVSSPSLLQVAKPEFFKMSDVSLDVIRGHEPDPGQLVIRAQGVIGNIVNKCFPTPGKFFLDCLAPDDHRNSFDKYCHFQSPFLKSDKSILSFCI